VEVWEVIKCLAKLFDSARLRLEGWVSLTSFSYNTEDRFKIYRLVKNLQAGVSHFSPYYYGGIAS